MWLTLGAFGLGLMIGASLGAVLMACLQLGAEADQRDAGRSPSNP